MIAREADRAAPSMHAWSPGAVKLFSSDWLERPQISAPRHGAVMGAGLDPKLAMADARAA